jgi:sugar lactone lactonase YvrE
MSQQRSIYWMLISLVVVVSLWLDPRWAAQPAALAEAAADLVIYNDATTWENWSWESTIDFASTQQVHAGARSIAVDYGPNYAGLSLRTAPPVAAASYTALSFWVYGGAGGTALTIYTQSTDNGGESTTVNRTAPAGTWTQITVTLAELGNPAQIARVNLQSNSAAAQPRFYVDDLRLIAAGGTSPFPDATVDRQIDFAKSLAGVAVAPDGRLYVSSWRESKIYSWAQATGAANPATSADMIFGVAMDPENPAGGAGCGAPTNESFCGPEGIVVDQAGNLYVAPTYENVVKIFRNPATDADPFVADVTITGLAGPRGLALDASGNLYVVNEFAQNGAKTGVYIFQQPLTTDTVADAVIEDAITFPLGVAVDSAGNVYVADAGAHNVKRYNAPLTTDLLVDQTYTGFSDPHDLAFDAAGNLYISDVVDFDHQPPNPPDSGNSRVAVIADPLNSTDIVHQFPNLAYPLGLDFDAAGNLYVALCMGPYPCSGAGRLLVFEAPADTPTPTNTPTNTPTTPAPNADIALTVDVSAGRQPISPYIYGLNFAKEAFAKEIALPLRRWGGNATTRYNWQNNATNHAADWFFHNNIKYNEYTGAAESADQWIAQNKRTGTESLVTLPMIGYVAKNGDQTTCGFAVSKYGPQEDVDNESGFPNCGNGRQIGGQPIVGNDPLDTSTAVDETFTANWVQQLKANAATNGPVRFYGLDNEPDLWFETHRDVYPNAWGYDQFRDLTYRYGAAIKAADAGAQLLGPDVHGWTYYWHSPYDGQREDWASPDDRNAHGGTPFVEWYLQQMRAYEQTNGVRLLDYFDLHFYPQNGVALSLAGDAAQQALRLRSTRALWDPSYIDESWIADAGPENGIVKLIPRMHSWVDANYPGTKLALTEYNWGGLEHINGALAQADILGIFGREGLDMAALWNYPSAELHYDKFETLPGAYAFRMYRNYDGKGSQFGDTRVQATSSDQSKLSIYAAQRTGDNALTLMIINKTGDNLNANLTVANLALAPAARVYRYSAADLTAIQQLPDIALTGNGLNATFPANSITLLQLAPGDGAPTPTPTATPPAPRVRRDESTFRL